MLPEEKYKQDVWFVLKKIRRKSLYRSSEEEPIEYIIHLQQNAVQRREEPEPIEESDIISQLIKTGLLKEKKPSQRIESRVGEHILNPIIGYYLEIVQPVFDKEYAKYAKWFTAQESREVSKSDHLVSKDKRGAYYYDGKLIEMQSDSLHYKVMDSLYSGQDQEGFLAYEDVEKALQKSGEQEIEETEPRNKRIRNGLQQLFRFAKVNGRPLTNKVPDGKRLIEIVRGKGLKLYNPKI